jgi:aminoglycoside phosphotransferase
MVGAPEVTYLILTIMPTFPALSLTDLPPMPDTLHIRLQNAALHANTEGMSSAGVVRIDYTDGAQHYLKYTPRETEVELQRELAVLLWLQGKLSVPEVAYYAEYGETLFLLMTAVPGMVVYDDGLRDRLPEVIRLYAEGLRRIHDLPVKGCPFDARLDVKLRSARRRLLANAVDEDDFDSVRAGRTAQSLYDELLATRPADEDLVFTHGDYCTPNVLIDPVRMTVSGYIDWGRAGIADRYQDVALAARSIVYNFGEEWVAPFFSAYGLREAEIDSAKVTYYQLLDELF